MVELDDNITAQLADAVIDLMERMEDKNEDKILVKVNLGRIKRLMSHDGIIAEVYVNDEDNFQYAFKDEHKSRKIEVIVAIYIKGVGEDAERLKLNAKDEAIKVLENNPTLDGLTGDNRILKVENGRRPEGDINKPTLFGASMIHVQYDAYN